MMKTSFTQFTKAKWLPLASLLCFLVASQIHLKAVEDVSTIAFKDDCNIDPEDITFVIDCNGELDILVDGAYTTFKLIDDEQTYNSGDFPLKHAASLLTDEGSFEIKIFCTVSGGTGVTDFTGTLMDFDVARYGGRYRFNGSTFDKETNSRTTRPVLQVVERDPTCGTGMMPGAADGSITVSFSDVVGAKCSGAAVSVELVPDGGSAMIQTGTLDDTFVFPDLMNNTYTVNATITSLPAECPCTIPAIRSVSSIILQGPLSGTTSLACNTRVNRSLDKNCRATISIDDVLRGVDDPCTMASIDSMAVLVGGVFVGGSGSDNYGITLDDATNAPVAGGATVSLLGQPVTIEVYSNDGNYCWGEIYLEDKAAPTIECSEIGVRQISCLEYDGTVQNAVENLIDDCNEYTTNIIPRSEINDCNELDPNILRRVIVEYSAVDIFGNESETCVETIDIVRFDTVPNNGVLDIPGCITLPPSFTTHPVYTETTTTTGPGGNCIIYPEDQGPLVCTGEYPRLYDGGAPAPISLADDGTGFPTLTYTDSDGETQTSILFPLNWDQAPDEYREIVDFNLRNCNIGVEFFDRPFDFGCKEKILRDWYLYEWSCSKDQGGDGEQRYFLGTQEIIITDNEAPTFDEFIADVEATVGPDQCNLTLPITLPAMSDSCDDDDVTREVGIYQADAYGNWILIGPTVADNGLQNTSFTYPVGTSYVVYTGYDDCMNIARDTSLVIISDFTAPSAICKRDLVIGISGTGIVSMQANSIDAGSRDQCDLEGTCVVRMDHLRIFRNLDTDNDGTVRFDLFERDLNNSDACYRDFSAAAYTVGRRLYIDEDNLCTEYVEFCCSDISSQPSSGVEVEFRAYDTMGNAGACWSNVTVQDKNQAIIECPTDYIEVRCEFELPSYSGHYSDVTNDPLSQYFGSIVEQGDQKVFGLPDEFLVKQSEDDKIRNYTDGTVFDNCGLPRISVNIDTNIPSCNKGTVTRRFYSHESSNDSVLVCTQVIRLVGTIGLDFDDLVADLDEEILLDECLSVEQVMNESFGSPITPNNVCTQALWSTEDQVFYFNQDDNSDACFKILRRFSLIDWCAEDRTEIIGTFTQVIKVSDNVAPTITCGEDMKLNVTDCMGGDVTLSASGEDQCTTGDLHIWSAVVELDLDNDGIYDETRTLSYDEITTSQTGALTSDATHTAKYPLGSHRITWTVSDRCGNSESCIQTFVIWNSKKPTPFAVDIATVLMDGTNPMVEVWAADLMTKSSEGPCGETLMYKIARVDSIAAGATDGGYSIAQDAITFYCSDIRDEGVDVNFFAFFQVGDEVVYDYTTVNVRIQDNTNLCNNRTSAFITGAIKTETRSGMPDIAVDLMTAATKTEATAPVMTNASGNYVFPAMPHGGSYILEPVSNNDDYVNGITTRDLILIQRHILGLANLDSPYRIIAADINGDQTVSALDMVELRRLILGITDILPNNDSWKFIDAAHQFVDPQYPFVGAISEAYYINSLSSDMNVNFIGLKVGDVDNSAELASTRSVMKIDVADQTFAAGDEVAMTLTSTQWQEIAGLQMSLDIDGSQLRFVGIDTDQIELAPEHIATEASNITISWNTLNSVSVADGDQLITLRFTAVAPGQLSSAVQLDQQAVQAEIYSDQLEISQMQLAYVETSGSYDYELHQNNPNPFADNTQISFYLPVAGDATLTISDVTGKVIKHINGSFDKGNNNIRLSKDELSTTGVLYYTLQTEKFTDTKRMIVLK